MTSVECTSADAQPPCNGTQASCAGSAFLSAVLDLFVASIALLGNALCPHKSKNFPFIQFGRTFRKFSPLERAGKSVVCKQTIAATRRVWAQSKRTGR